VTQVHNESFSPGMEPHRGVLVLVLGILSIVICGILGPVAWIMGKGDIRKIDQGQMDPTGRGLTMGGMICGIIGTILLSLGILYVIVVVVIIGGMAAAGAAAGG